MKKKLLSTLLIVVIIFNFIFCNCAYADPDTSDSDMSKYGEGSISSDGAKSLAENGTDSSGTSMSHDNFGISFTGIIFQTLALIFDVFPMAIQTIMSIVTINPSQANIQDFLGAEESLDNDPSFHFTIERVVFNDITILNANVFDQGATITNGTGSSAKTVYQHGVNIRTKQNIATWFYTLRLMATMINLCILIYIGIRMAISNIASEEAKYKKMFIWWAESMVVLFFLHYIMYIILQLNQVVINIIYTLRAGMVDAGNAVSFEDIIMDKVYGGFLTTAGSTFFLYSIFFWFLTAMHVKFLFAYVKRMFTIYFLVAISPLITVTYPIDKLDNGKAEAFEKWLKEFVINIIIQPIHAMVYLIFVYTAGKIAEKSPIVSMIFLLSFGRIENIVRNVFRVTDSVSNINSAVKGGGKKPGLLGLGKMFIGGKGK